MVTPVGVAAVSTQCVSVHTTPKVILVIAACHSTTTSRGVTEKRTMPIRARSVTVTAMPPLVITMPRSTRSQTAMTRVGAECAKTVSITQVSSLNLVGLLM